MTELGIKIDAFGHDSTDTPDVSLASKSPYR